MLPLWIIDLREQSSRRDFFESLVGKINYVHVASHDGVSCNLCEEDSPSPDKGYFWWYSRMTDYYYGISISGNENPEIRARHDAEHVRFEIENPVTPEGSADRLYAFQSDLVKEGQAFVKELRKSSASPSIKYNVVVLGDLTEDFTRIVFPSIGRIVQKEKGRIVPYHIHQGMEIVGMLYVPTDINTRHVDVRKSMLRTLKEIDVQYRVNDMRGYDHMMLYQDVQNRTESVYPLLNDEQLAQYLLQCISHLFLACDETHPLLSGTTAADAFYFSMGASSLYYDSENECIQVQNNLAHEFIKHLKSQGIDEKARKLILIDEDLFSPKTIFSDFDVLGHIGTDIFEIEDPTPHPVYDYLRKTLKRYYYGVYLRYFSKNLMHSIHARIEDSTKAALKEIASKSKRRFTDIQKTISDGLDRLWGDISANDGGIPAFENLFKELQTTVSQQKQIVPDQLKIGYWRIVEEDHVSKELSDKFQEYHDAYLDDIKKKTEGKQQLKIKKEAIDELNGAISKESTLLGMMGRTALLSIMLVLALVPVLCLVSPRLINLGNVRRYSEIWSVAIFVIPSILMTVKYWKYQRRKERLVNNLKAIYLHDAFARVANRMESEIGSFYDKLIELSSCYIQRCNSIMKEVGPGYKDEHSRSLLFPTTMFNQPLLGGKFGDSHIVPTEESDDVEIRINYIKYKQKDLSPIEHFLFINQNKDLVKELFSDVRISENLVRRVSESGEEVLLTKAQQEEELSALWEDHKARFYNKLKKAVKESVVISENKTIGEKIVRFTQIYGQDLLKPCVDFAAANGELVSSSDQEYVDAKINDKRVKELITPFLTYSIHQFQSDAEHNVYGNYLFVTRWRCFDKLILNRILPTEDFDGNEYGKKVVAAQSDEEEQYSPRPSSLLLWSLSLFDASTEWYRLFDATFLDEAYEDKQIYRRIMNQND